jgi:hypothetical protein
VLSGLHQVFVGDNVRSISPGQLASGLDDDLYALNQRLGDPAAPRFPKPARAYLDDWAAPEAGRLRKYYPDGNDEPHFEATPALEKALAWVQGLGELTKARGTPAGRSGGRVARDIPGSRRLTLPTSPSGHLLPSAHWAFRLFCLLRAILLFTILRSACDPDAKRPGARRQMIMVREGR